MADAPARIALLRRIEWGDTDAAGVYHWSTAFRLVEAAEAVLHDRLGIRDHTFGRTPRVHVSCDFHRELRFFDAVRIELSVSGVGETSARYEFTLAPPDGGDPTARGEMVIVHITGSPGGTSAPWPPEIRERLEAGGDQGLVDQAGVDDGGG